MYSITINLTPALKIHLAIQDITRFPRFQHHIEACLTVLTGADRFQWLGPCPSWCLEFLDPAGWIETSPKEKDLNGIFLLPHERTKEMWEHYQKGMNISRLTPYSNLLQKDYTRLLQPQLWLNDEIVNTYMALIRSSVKQDHLVLFSHFYQKISLLESCHPDVIKGYVSCIEIFPEIEPSSPLAFKQKGSRKY
jgi:hypothetical protein